GRDCHDAPVLAVIREGEVGASRNDDFCVDRVYHGRAISVAVVPVKKDASGHTSKRGIDIGGCMQRVVESRLRSRT
ncbi:MAG: hypothetical protein NDJ18_06065, partial [candidate division Zixibacteria bacterium]|nr:hypothetical protein [candidate division Zixibacteria bacterium]